MNFSDDAPALLHYNPETESEEIHDDFVELYEMARRHLCYMILTDPDVDSVWQSTMRRKWRSGNHVQYRSRLDAMVNKAWDQICPAEQQIRDLASIDPTLLDVHSGLAHTYDVRRGRVSPEKIARYNLRMWITQALYWFWKRRLDGRRTALFNVQSESVTLEGVVPAVMMEVYAHGLYSSGPHSVKYKYR